MQVLQFDFDDLFYGLFNQRVKWLGWNPLQKSLMCLKTWRGHIFVDPECSTGFAMGDVQEVDVVVEQSAEENDVDVCSFLSKVLFMSIPW